MDFVISFVKGVLTLLLAVVALYYGLKFYNEIESGFWEFWITIILIPVILYSAAFIAEKLTFGKLGTFGHTVATILILAIFARIYMMQSVKKDMAALQKAAQVLGLKYQQDVKLPAAMLENPLFDRGFMPKAQHLLSGKFSGVDVKIFNYQYEKLERDTEDRYWRTAVAFSITQKQVPDFYLRPWQPGERFLEKNPIDFREDPQFSKKYFLTGSNAEDVRALFGERQREVLKEIKRKWAIAAANGYLVMYADETMNEEVKPDPEAIREYLEQAWVIFKELTSERN